jgi:hypothetical protein
LVDIYVSISASNSSSDLEFWKFSLANGNLKTFQLSFLDSAVYVYFWGPSPSVFVVSYLPFAPFGYAPVPCFDESEHLVLASLPLAMIVLLERAEQEKPAFGKPDQFARHDFGVLSSLGFH